MATTTTSSPSAAAAGPVRVQIISDVVWPFCYVGLRHLQQAAASANVEYHLEWEPFLLNPNMDEEGEDLREHLVGKYGPGAVRMLDDPNNHLMESGRKVGIQFTNKRKIYPTVKAHAVMEHVKEHVDNDTANQLMEALYKAYFEEAKNINSADVLKSLVQSVGLEPSSIVDTALEDWQRLESIKAKDHKVKRKMGVSGVPFFMIFNASGQGRPVGFSGAQPAEIIAEVLQEAADA